MEALKGISFKVRRGELFGLLDPNGAGKTTTIKILTTLLKPSSGTAKVLGYDVVSQAREVRGRINLVAERTLYWRLSAYENPRYFASIYYVPRDEAEWDILILRGNLDEKDLLRVVEGFIEVGTKILSVERVEPTLEDVFIKLIGRALRD